MIFDKTSSPYLDNGALYRQSYYFLDSNYRKPYASYRMVSLSMTLSDADPGFKVAVFLKGKYLQNYAFYEYRHSYYHIIIIS